MEKYSLRIFTSINNTIVPMLIDKSWDYKNNNGYAHENEE